MLGLHDVISTVVLVAMVRAALVNRRKVWLHAGYMLGTVLLVFPPILARLPIPIPPWAHFGELVPMAIALGLYLMRRRDGLPFLIVVGTMVLQIVQFHTLGASALWAGWFAGLGALSPWPLALAAMALAAAALWSAWNPWAPAVEKAKAT
ncbi:MAG: hypothetical protein EOP59_09765 [Sphingomonadales bacterium]|nr:MAG: hypothetical protein EOP59_09765 [Sphingomonadales bacterium]